MKPLPFAVVLLAVWVLAGCDNSQSDRVSASEARADAFRQENLAIREDLSRLQTANARLDQENQQLRQQIQEQQQAVSSLNSRIAAQTGELQKLAVEKAAIEQRLTATPAQPASPPQSAVAVPEQVPPEILAAIKEAAQCKDYGTAVVKFKQCEDVISVIANAETQNVARQQLMLSREFHLNNEMMEHLTTMRLAKGRMPFDTVPARANTARTFSDETDYKAALAQYQLCLKHNAEVRKFNEAAVVFKSRLAEIQKLQADRSVPWKTNPNTLMGEFSRLQQYVALIPVSGAPKLVRTEQPRTEQRGPTIRVSPVIRP